MKPPESLFGPEFTVVMRFPSAVLIRPETELQIATFAGKSPVIVKFATRWHSLPSNGGLVPGDLWAEIKGAGESLDAVLAPFANAANACVPRLSFCGNAAILPGDIELGFESTRGLARRAYFQNFLPSESDYQRIGRFLDLEATSVLFSTMAGNREIERLQRGMTQYMLSLDHWRFGRETQCLAHLWACAEALTKAVCRVEIKKRGLANERDLADELGISLDYLQPSIRKTFIFQNDDECYKKAKRARNGLEHGSENYDVLRGLSRSIREKTASYMRTAILNLLNLDQKYVDSLNGQRCALPMGYSSPARYLRTSIIGENPILAADGNQYPSVVWETSIISTRFDDEGVFHITPREQITASLGSGLKFEDIDLQIWKPN